MDNYLMTWFYAEKETDKSFYPSVGGNASFLEFQKVYWRCGYDFYRSAQLAQTANKVKYLFFTNVPNIPTDIDGLSLDKFFEVAGVKVMQLELTNRIPKDWHGVWRNQFHLFDILEYLKSYFIGNSLIFDSDIFVAQNLLPAFRDIQKKAERLLR